MAIERLWIAPVVMGDFGLNKGLLRKLAVEEWHYCLDKKVLGSWTYTTAAFRPHVYSNDTLHWSAVLLDPTAV